MFTRRQHAGAGSLLVPRFMQAGPMVSASSRETIDSTSLTHTQWKMKWQLPLPPPYSSTYSKVSDPRIWCKAGFFVIPSGMQRRVLVPKYKVLSRPSSIGISQNVIYTVEQGRSLRTVLVSYPATSSEWSLSGNLLISTSRLNPEGFIRLRLNWLKKPYCQRPQ